MTGPDSNKKLNVPPYQIFNVLDEDSFKQVVLEKTFFIKNTENGYNKRLKFDYSPESIGIFSKVCDKIKNSLIESGFENPKITSIDFINHVHRKTMPFHKHWMLPTLNPYGEYNPVKNSNSPYAIPYEYFWIAIYYPHELHDIDYAGELIVKLNHDDMGINFNAIPNSMVLHNGLYGHEVKINKLHPRLLRSACFTQWVCDFK